MADNYLVNLLFKDGQTGINNVSHHSNEINEAFGGELTQNDFLCRTDSALSSDLAGSASDAEETTATSSWNLHGLDDRQPDCVCGESFAQNSPSTAITIVGSQSRCSSFSPQRIRSSAIDTQSQISERLQSCLQADDVGLDGFSFPSHWSASNGSFHDQPYDCSQSDAYHLDHRDSHTTTSTTADGSYCHHHHNPNSKIFSTLDVYSAVRAKSPSPSRDYHHPGISTTESRSLCCSHQHHSALWLFQLGVGLGESNLVTSLSSLANKPCASLDSKPSTILDRDKQLNPSHDNDNANSVSSFRRSYSDDRLSYPSWVGLTRRSFPLEQSRSEHSTSTPQHSRSIPFQSTACPDGRSVGELNSQSTSSSSFGTGIETVEMSVTITSRETNAHGAYRLILPEKNLSHCTVTMAMMCDSKDPDQQPNNHSESKLC